MRRGYQRDALLRFACDIFEGKAVSVSGAAQEYTVSERTIERWLTVIESIVPLARLRPDATATTYYRRERL